MVVQKYVPRKCKLTTSDNNQTHFLIAAPEGRKYSRQGKINNLLVLMAAKCISQKCKYVLSKMSDTKSTYLKS